MMPEDMEYVLFFTDASPDTALLGGKGSNIIRLVKIGMRVPPGFIITTHSYARFLEESEHKKQLKKLLSSNPHPRDLVSFSEKMRKLIVESRYPKDLESEISAGFARLRKEFGDESSFAVRSSATIEDMDTFSFAGQGNTYLYNNSLDETLLSVRNCWASLFSPQALTYFLRMGRMKKASSLSDIQMAVIVQKMVEAKVSGVLFSANVINNNKNEMMINSTWGLGETIANNSVVPDMVILEKNEFKILKIVVGKKEKMSIKNPRGSHTIVVDTDPQLKVTRSLQENQLRELHKLALKLEREFKSPQDVEWAIENDTIYILQSRPITTLKN